GCPWFCIYPCKVEPICGVVYASRCPRACDDD
nr:Chain A, LH2 [synthetic construct]